MISICSGPKRAYVVLVWTLLFFTLTLSSCNSGADQGQQPQSQETGALAFKAVWPQPGTQNANIPSESTEETEDVCTTFDIETITASVLDAQGAEQGSGSWPCTAKDHRGTISSLPAGSGYRVLVQGLIAEKPAWQGEATDITVEANRTEIIEKLIMHTLDYTLTASSSAGGSIEPSGSITVSSIDEQAFTFTADAGYEIDNVFINGDPQGQLESYTFSNLDASSSIYVSFTPTGTATTHTITATTQGSGSIVPQGEIEVVEGNDQTFTFVPAAGNHVADVVVDGVSQSASPSHTFENVTEDHTISVTFDATMYTITATAGTGGSISPQGTISVSATSVQTFTFTPDTDYIVDDVIINGTSYGYMESHTFSDLDADQTIHVSFEPAAPAVTHTITAVAEGGGSILPDGQVVVTRGNDQIFTFHPNAGNHVAEIFVDGVSQGAAPSHTIENVTANHSIRVVFATNTHTITASAEGAGSISPDGQVPVSEGGSQTFTFHPDTGHHVADVFVDDVSQGAAPSHTIDNVTQNYAIRVVFAANSYTITATAGAGGQIDPAGDVAAAHGAEPSFTITPNPGFYLSSLQVSGADVTPQSTYTFAPVTGNATIAAVFEPVWFVDVDAANGGDGRTWQTAFNSLSDAIYAANNDDEIWIKAGTYPLSAQVVINKRVNIYAGFNNTDHFRYQRDWENKQAIFDGQLSTRCFYITSAAHLNGLIIQNSDISASGYADLQGGAMYIANSSPTIANCTFRNNIITGDNTCYASAAYGYSSSPSFDNCLFEDNSLSCEWARGGAMRLENCTTTIRNCRFIDNVNDSWLQIGNGGAIDIVDGAVHIAGSEFRRNRTSSEFAAGGAINCANAALTLSESIFIENVATSGRSSQGGAVDISGSSAVNGDLIFRNVIFLRNTATGAPRFAYGGAIYNGDASPKILNCTFSGNLTNSSEVSQGGAIFNGAGNPAITNTILWGNAAFIDTNDTISNGEGIQLYDPSSHASVSFSDIDQDNYIGNGNIRVVPRLDQFGHLRAGSACLDMAEDTAAPATDVHGEARPQNGRSDIGADELVDTDSDGMPDFWETRYNLDIGIDDAGSDQDGDGLSNIDEYMAGLDPTETNLWVPARHRGWYDSSGFHDDNNGSTICGKQNDNEYRSYFTFDLSGASGTVVGAILRLEVVAYDSIRLSESFNVYHVATDPAALEAWGSGQTTIYQDLADGDFYAQDVTVSPDDVGKAINIYLTPEAIVQINASLGGQFAVGVGDKSYTLDRSDAILFSTESKSRTHQLVLMVD